MDEHWELRGEFEAPLLEKRPSKLVREWPIYVSLDAGETLLPETVDLPRRRSLPVWLRPTPLG